MLQRVLVKIQSCGDTVSFDRYIFEQILRQVVVVVNIICSGILHRPRCQHQRTKKRDRADEKALKAELGFFFTAKVRNVYCSTSSRRYTDFARDTINCDNFIRSPTQAKHIKVYIFAERIWFAEHWKLFAESSEFDLTLSRANRAHFFQLEIRKKAGHFKRKAGKRDGPKNREFTPERGNVDTYDIKRGLL